MLRLPGEELDEEVRAFMEPRFGFDFRDVRVHSDSRAARSAESVASHAFTCGSHIVFGQDRYQPATAHGRELLAHELAHVIQQANTTALALQRQPATEAEIQKRIDELEQKLRTSSASADEETEWYDEIARLEKEKEDLPVSRARRDVASSKRSLADVERQLSTSSTTQAKESELWYLRNSDANEVAFAEQAAQTESDKDTRRFKTLRKFRGESETYIKARFEKYISGGLPPVYDLETFEDLVQKRFPNASWRYAAELKLARVGQGSDSDQARRTAQLLATPVGPPNSVDDAVALLNEARWWRETEHSPSGEQRGVESVTAIEEWLAPLVDWENEQRRFGHLSYWNQRLSVEFPNQAYGLIQLILRKWKLGATIGGYWDVTATALKGAKESLQILAGQKKIEDTSLSGTYSAMNRGMVYSAVGIPAAALAPGLLVAGAGTLTAGAAEAQWLAVRAAPRLATWVGMHPLLAAELGTQALGLGEKYHQTGEITPEDVLWSALSLGYSDFMDQSATAPRSGAPASQSKGGGFGAKLVLNTMLGIREADVLPSIPAGGGGGSPRAMPTLVESAPLNLGRPSDMPDFPFSTPTPTAAASVAPAPVPALGDEGIPFSPSAIDAQLELTSPSEHLENAAPFSVPGEQTIRVRAVPPGRWSGPLSPTDERNYVQYTPELNPRAEWRRQGPPFNPPVGGGTVMIGPRTYQYNAAGDLEEATTTELTLGVRDPVMYSGLPNLDTSREDFGHLLGIDFGHIDAQVGRFGGFRQASSVNRPLNANTPSPWYDAERATLAEALRLQNSGQPLRVVAEARNFTNGVPAATRIYLESNGRIVRDSGWIANPVFTSHAPGP